MPKGDGWASIGLPSPPPRRIVMGVTVAHQAQSSLTPAPVDIRKPRFPSHVDPVRAPYFCPSRPSLNPLWPKSIPEKFHT
jgi:hypothetical protein